jgi:16S rRNA (uracil1498-N3)-methyltransferase
MKRNPIFFRINFQMIPTIKLFPEEMEHLKSLRLEKEEKVIEIRDGYGSSYFYEVGFKKDIGNLVENKKNVVHDLHLQVATALPKSQKLDLILQKGTEMGVSVFHLVTFLQSDRKELNEERCQKIVSSASSQCRRHSLPAIYLYSSLKEYLEKCPNSFYLHPYTNLDITQNNDYSLIPVVGPEGGFREEEINLFTEYKCPGYNLGDNIFRIETAALYITSIAQYHKLRIKYD